MQEILLMSPAIKKQNNFKLIIDAISKVKKLKKNYYF